MICDEIVSRETVINVSICTKIVPRNALSQSKSTQVQSKPSYKLWFATKSSPGHKRLERYRNTPKNVLRRSKKLPGTVKFALQAMICDEIVSWASTWRGTLKQSSKTCSAGRKTPTYSQIRAINYDLRQNHLLGIKVSKYIETVLENVLSVSKNSQVHSNSPGSYLLGMNVSPHTSVTLRFYNQISSLIRHLFIYIRCRDDSHDYSLGIAGRLAARSLAHRQPTRKHLLAQFSYRYIV